MELTELIWKVVAPVASGAAGVAGTLWRVTKDLEDRLRVVEREKLVQIDGHITALKTLISQLESGTNSEFDKLYEELKGRGKERREERRLISRLTENYLAHQTRITNCENVITKLNESFTEHAKGQQEQWQEISRALGNIEGWLRAMSSRRSSSGEFPGPPKTR